MGCIHCGKKITARFLCRAHYQQAWKDGTIRENLGPRDENTLRVRLLAKYAVAPNGCWEWTAQRRKDKMDYGLIWRDGKLSRAHRVSYELHKGEIPEGIDVLHKCDNPCCINPDHLFLGTRGDNCRDAASKNRFPLNERHWNTKLSIEDVAAIRASSETRLALGMKYNVNPSTITKIKNGQRRTKV